MKHFVHILLVVVLSGALADSQRVYGEVAYPSGTQNFESMSVGDGVQTLPGWPVVNESMPADQFTVEAADDGGPPPALASTRWLRVTDTDGTAVQNRFYSPTIVAPQTHDYEWTVYVKLETTPPGGGATKPRIAIQHVGDGFANAWGIAFTDSGANLIVTGIGGSAASTLLYPLSGATAVGDWVKLKLRVLFSQNTVSASANDGAFVSLPIALSGDPKVFRFCYRGEDSGNVAQLLIDDVSVFVGVVDIPAASTWGLAAMVLLLAICGTVLVERRLNRHGAVVGSE